MSIESRSKQYGQVFGHWQIKESLGRGSGGSSVVYRLEHTDGSGICCAMKAISLIEQKGKLENLSPYQREEYEHARQRCWDRAKEEVLLLNGLQGKTNIVGYRDHIYVDWSDERGFGRDMLIQMELLEDLRGDLQKRRILSAQEIRKLGMDICTALILCHGKQIIHRDIKPENIFYNEDGDYKLGDFGISKIMNATSHAVVTTAIGTPEYAAPEQSSGSYDVRVDIYSLGLVLYELSNRNRLPFVDNRYVSSEEMTVAMQKRSMGIPMPAPCDADPQLAAVICKACAYRPEDRYQTAREFLQALEQLPVVPVGVAPAAVGSYATQPALQPQQDSYATSYVKGGYDTAYAPARQQDSYATAYVQQPPGAQSAAEKPKKKKLILGILLGTACAVVLACVLFLSGKEEQPEQKPEGTSTEQPQPEESSAEQTLPPTTLDPLEEAYLAAREQADTMAAQGNYDGAIFYLQGQAALYPQDTRYGELADQYITQRTGKILDNAQAYAENHQFRQAIRLLDDTWKQYQDPRLYAMAGEYRLQFGQYVNSVIAAGKYNSAVIQNGRLSVVGKNEFGENDANFWTDITAVTVGDRYVLGLHSDGTVSLAGQYEVGKPVNAPLWSNVIAISGGDCHAVGLTESGKVVATGHNGHGQTEVSKLMSSAGGRRIVSIAAGYTHTLALLEDGIVLACGNNRSGACNVGQWTDVVAISAGTEFSAALLSDGTVRITGKHEEYFTGYGWTDICAIAAGDYFLIGLKEDGTVVASPVDKNNANHSDDGQLDVYYLRDIVQIAAGHNHVMALDKNGVLHCIGPKSKGACDMDGMQISQ